MIPHGVDVFVGLDPIDLRWGFERLAGLVTERLGRDVRGGALFLFFGRRRDALKIVFFDGSGLCIFYKRLDEGTFRVPEAPREGVAALEIDERVLEDLLDGVDVTPASSKPRRRRNVH
jgi:transposase